jgi:branched-subunit amino acid transport protein
MSVACPPQPQSPVIFFSAVSKYKAKVLSLQFPFTVLNGRTIQFVICSENYLPTRTFSFLKLVPKNMFLAVVGAVVVSARYTLKED